MDGVPKHCLKVLMKRGGRLECLSKCEKLEYFQKRFSGSLQKISTPFSNMQTRPANPNVSLAIGSDHAGFSLKTFIANTLREQGWDVVDFGTHSADSVDYPDVAHPLAEAVASGSFSFGILICGSGQGVNITANKHEGVRSALVWLPEIAELSRKHNNANIITLPARFIDEQTALECVNRFLQTDFEGGRHAARVDKI